MNFSNVDVYVKNMSDFDTLDLLYAYKKDFSFFTLFFQKQVDLNTHKTLGFESLLRFQGNLPTPISTATCLEWIQERNLIKPFQHWMIHTVLDSLAFLPNPLYIAMNICAESLTLDYAKEIIRLLKVRHGAFHRIHLEITETKRPLCFKNLAKAVALLRHYGICVALDDFGTGFATMQYLVHTDLDAIKIDRSYIQGLHENCTKQNMLRHMLDLMVINTRTVVAEGIEDTKDATAFKRLCESFNVTPLVQGYAYGYPSALKNILKDLAA